MQFHLHNTRRVIYYTKIGDTFLQPLDSCVTRIVLETVLPPELSTDNCYDFLFMDNKFVHQPTSLDDTKLLNAKAKLLHKIDNLVSIVRFPFFKNTIGQSEVYQQKLIEAKKYILGEKEEFKLLEDEAEILQIDLKIVALQIIRTCQERDWILRCSERARRFFNSKVSKAESFQELTEIDKSLIKRNFRLPVVIK